MSADTKPWGYAVNSVLYRGEHARDDAERDAARCGGMARAVALFTAPQPTAAVPKDVSIVVDVMRRTEMARAVFAAVRKELQISRIGPWPAFDANEQQRIVDSLIPFTRPAPFVPAGFVWPEPPKRRGQSPTLFDDGYEEGWAKCLSVVQALLSAAPKPAGKEGV